MKVAKIFKIAGVLVTVAASVIDGIAEIKMFDNVKNQLPKDVVKFIEEEAIKRFKESQKI